MRKPIGPIVLFVLVSLFKQDPLSAQIPDAAPPVNVAPDLIRINAFYKGTDVSVRADLPYACDGAVVKIQGTVEEETLNKKGKISIFWLNVGEVTVSNAPRIYILNSSGPLDKICSLQERTHLLLGYEALQERIRLRSNKDLTGSEFSEFVILKEHSGSYQRSTTVQLIPGDADTTVLKAMLHIPPVMPSGAYQIQLYFFKNLVLRGQTQTPLRVETVGVPNYLYSLAYNHPAAYGLLAIVIAMATGIVMGVIFGSRSRRKQ
jgi:uncharacterized protein (TIGR02186 family)